MENVVGIPTELLFSVIGGLGVYIFLQEKKYVRERLLGQDSKISELTKNSKQDFAEIKSFVKEAIKSEINSREFRDELKQSVKDIILHCDNNRSKGEAVMFEHLEKLIMEINKKLP